MKQKKRRTLNSWQKSLKSRKEQGKVKAKVVEGTHLVILEDLFYLETLYLMIAPLTIITTYGLVPLISAAIGGYISYYFSSKANKNETVTKFKEEKYANLLIHLQGFIGNTAASDPKKKFFEEQYKSWIYASDEVVIATNKMIQLVINAQGQDPGHEQGRQGVGNIVLAMRKDLLGRTKLTYKDFRYTNIVKDR